jgi:hypothetical protein
VLVAFGGAAGRAGSDLRLVVGDLNAHVSDYIRDGSFAARLLTCYATATAAGITVAWLDQVLEQLFNEQPKYLASVSVQQNSILMALAQDARVLGATTFVSREDVDLMLVKMKDWFDQARQLAAAQRDNPGYNALISLAGAITRYLADVARPMPRMLQFSIAPMPSLTMSQYIYYEGGRSEELIAENKVVHPLFMPTSIRGLSS